MVKIDLQFILLALVIGYLVRYAIVVIYTKGFKSGGQYMEMKDTKQLLGVADYLKKTLSEVEYRGIELLLNALMDQEASAHGANAIAPKNEDSSNKTCGGFADRS